MHEKLDDLLNQILFCGLACRGYSKDSYRKLPDNKKEELQTTVLYDYLYNVENLDNAIERVKTVCAPLNTKRLNMETYCGHKGSCVSLNSENPFMSDGCSGSSRICCNYLVSAMQRKKDRIKVIIVNEDLGY